MRKAYNCYLDGSFTNPQNGHIEKTGVGTWLIPDCLPFDPKKFPYSLPTEDNNIVITNVYDSDNKTLTLTVKKDGVLYDCRGFTVSVNYEDMEPTGEEI